VAVAAGKRPASDGSRYTQDLATPRAQTIIDAPQESTNTNRHQSNFEKFRLDKIPFLSIGRGAARGLAEMNGKLDRQNFSVAARELIQEVFKNPGRSGCSVASDHQARQVVERLAVADPRKRMGGGAGDLANPRRSRHTLTKPAVAFGSALNERGECVAAVAFGSALND
jgi:hypothetical protein